MRLLVLGTIRLPPTRLDAARSVMLNMIAASRSEKGCQHYSYAADLLEPGLIHVKEIWTDRDALAAHMLSAHLQAWRARWPDLEISDRRLVCYDIDEGQAV